jgi:hypothetical protein
MGGISGQTLIVQLSRKYRVVGAKCSKALLTREERAVGRNHFTFFNYSTSPIKKHERKKPERGTWRCFLVIALNFVDSQSYRNVLALRNNSMIDFHVNVYSLHHAT